MKYLALWLALGLGWHVYGSSSHGPFHLQGPHIWVLCILEICKVLQLQELKKINSDADMLKHDFKSYLFDTATYVIESHLRHLYTMWNSSHGRSHLPGLVEAECSQESYTACCWEVGLYAESAMKIVIVIVCEVWVGGWKGERKRGNIAQTRM